MKRPFVLCAPLFLLLAAPAVAAEADVILGRWQTEPTDKGYAHVEVVAEGGLYQGRIVWLSEPDFPAGDEMAGQPKLDRLNPDPQLRGRPIIGLALMEGFSYEGEGRWKGGRIYDPETGKTYKCNLRLDQDGTLRVRGYVGISLIGRTTVWVRPPTR